MQVKPLLLNTERWTFSQNGIRFRTLCGDCNNRRLGLDSDKELVKLSDAARVLLRRRRHTRASVNVDASKVMRSVFGHLLAARIYTPHSKSDERMRDFVLNPTAAQPQDLWVYYWAQPDLSLRLMLETAIIERGVVTICSLLVWHPLGFKVCVNRPDSSTNLPLLNDYLNAGQVPLRPRPVGEFDAWFDRIPKITGAAGMTAVQALDRR